MKFLISEGAPSDDEDTFEDIDLDDYDDESQAEIPLPVRRWQPGSGHNPVIYRIRDSKSRPFGALKKREDINAEAIRSQIERECRARDAFERSWIPQFPRERDRKSDRPDPQIVKQIDRWRSAHGLTSQGIGDMRSYEQAMDYLKLKQSHARRGLAPPVEPRDPIAMRVYPTSKRSKKRSQKAARPD